MLNERKMMNAACINTNCSEAFCGVDFTVSIVDPRRDARECTEGINVVQQLLTHFGDRS